MGLFHMPKFIRRMVRRVMYPVSENKAWTTREKLSIVYAIIAWHALAFVGYQIYIGNKHWPETLGVESPDIKLKDLRPAAQYSYMLGVKKATVYRISGFQISRPENIAVDEKLLEEYQGFQKTEQQASPQPQSEFQSSQ